MALPLLEAGHDVHCVSNRIPPFWESYSTYSLYADIGQLCNTIKALDPHVDLFHCHNEPSWFVSLVKEVSDKPVVLDVHDSYLSRTTPKEDEAKKEANEVNIRVTTEERNNFQLADALVYPGEAFRQTVQTEFALDQPALTLPSYVPQFLYRYNTAPWLGGVVYEGRVQMPKDAKHGFQYCEYLDLAKRFNTLGVDFHLYAGKTQKEYHELYQDIAFVHVPLDYRELLKAVSGHDWALVGNIQPTPQWAVAMPNKLFEYLAAQVPVVVMHADACAEFVEREGVGIAVGSPEELRDRWAEHRTCRAEVIKKRRKWAMESHIHKLEELYAEVL